MTIDNKLKSGMQSYADTATDVAPVTTNGAQARVERPESRKRWILNAFDVSDCTCPTQWSWLCLCLPC